MGNICQRSSSSETRNKPKDDEVHDVERGLKVVKVTMNHPLFAAAIDVMGRSFCGTTAARPEGIVDWAYAGEAQTRGAPLPAAPTAVRLKWFAWMTKWAAYKTLWSGGSVYALVDDSVDGGPKVLAATNLLPPSAKALYKTSALQFARLVLACGSPPKTDDKSDYWAHLDRLDASEKVMHEFHARHTAGPHWYVFCFATDPNEQGRGYGSVLLRFICALADKDGVDAYLETDGERNVGFYKAKGGFDVVDSRTLTCRGVTFDSDGGAYAMLRRAKKNQNNGATSSSS